MSKALRKLERWCNRSLPKSPWVDSLVAFIRFHNVHGRFPQSSHGSLNDALFWIKASGQLAEPLRRRTSDKELVKTYIRETVGDRYNIPTIAVLRNPEAARAFSYPERCAIKPTHTSGDVILRQDGDPLDLDRICSWFQQDYYDHGRERNYKDLIPKVIVEPLLFDRIQVDDFKVFCVKGVPKIIQMDRGRHTDHRRCLYSCEWELLPYSIAHPLAVPIEAPGNLSEMLDLASRLSKPFNFVRVDCFNDGVGVYAGEITHCHGNLDERFFSKWAEWDFAQRVFGPEGFQRSAFKHTMPEIAQR